MKRFFSWLLLAFVAQAAELEGLVSKSGIEMRLEQAVQELQKLYHPQKAGIFIYAPRAKRMMASAGNIGEQKRFEPGHTIAPLTLKLALDEGVGLHECVKTHKGRLRFGSIIVKDRFGYDKLTALDVVVFGSNVGLFELARKVDPQRYETALKRLGFVYHEGRLSSELVRGAMGYGFGLLVTAQGLARMYDELVNDSSVKEALVDGVTRGKSKMEIPYRALVVGASRSVVPIVTGGRYTRMYRYVAFGFAEDGNGRRFVIGAIVEAPSVSKRDGVDAARWLFARGIDALVAEGMLLARR